MQKPIISVIIPVYNRTELLKEAVASVLAQTFPKYELIIADDCSTEDIEKAIYQIPAIEKANLKIIKLPKHSGMAGFVRNIGVKNAIGKYLAFLDSDDLWLPEKLEKQLNIMESSDKILISHTRELWKRGEKTVSQASQKHKREGEIFEDSLVKCIIGPSTVMMTRELFEKFGGFKEDLEVAEDYELWLRITSQNKIAYIDEPLTIKRAGDWQQLSAKYGQIEIFRINALKNLLDKNFFTGEKKELAQKSFKRKCEIYSIGCRKRGKITEADYYENLGKN